jgi:hypothetical protein
MDAGYQVGTTDFNLASVGEIDSVDDLLIDNVARFLLKGWEGVGQLVDGVEVAIDYTPEIGIVMLKQHPELYWRILAEAANIAQGKELQTQETVKSPRSAAMAERVRRRAGRKAKWRREKLNLPPILSLK